MINTTYLIYVVKTYFSTVFFIWVIGNILLRVLVKKKKKKVMYFMIFGVFY